MDAKETLKYLYEHGHIISGENYKIIKNELNENARLKALLSHSKTQLEFDELQAENAQLQKRLEVLKINRNDLFDKNVSLNAELKAENEKARLFRLEVQVAIEALRILEQALGLLSWKDKDND